MVHRLPTGAYGNAKVSLPNVPKLFSFEPLSLFGTAFPKGKANFQCWISFHIYFFPIRSWNKVVGFIGGGFLV